MRVNGDFYRKNGYLLLKNFLDKSEVDTVLTEARNVFRRQFEERDYAPSTTNGKLNEPQFNENMYRLFEEDFECLSNCGKQVQHLISLHSLSLKSEIVELLLAVGLTSPTVSTRPVMFFNHPRLAKQKVFHTVDPHQDWRSMQGSLNSVVIWVPLIDIPRELGALEILPGSHLHGLRTDHIEKGFGMVKLTDEENKKMLSVEVNVGDALLFSSFLIHQSGQNVTDRPRWSCHFRYNDLDEATFIERKFAHPYIYKPSEELITPNFPVNDDINRIFQA
ncbi:MAG TPA: phytanoyl-CoA dioxygenase family protein [Cyclobacteriaceae bacterium]|nr:phytanoyl-CoA dioxygenase family protein [Cyclobacteriaceae bacterium]